MRRGFFAPYFQPLTNKYKIYLASYIRFSLSLFQQIGTIMKLTNGTWFDCKESKGQWKEGEYLIEHESASMTKYAIWHRGMIACGPFKTLKSAYESLQTEFNSIEKIND